MISLEKVGKTYRTGDADVNALQEVSLEIGSGQYVALLGPSGSGKSTLLHILGCLDRPTSGRYRLDGIDTGTLDVNQLADIRNRKIGFVFQSFQLMPRLSAQENVALPMMFAGVAASDRQNRAAKLLGMMGLSERLRHRPSELSGGQQQRVAIARALANEPPVLLADEPTGNLDSRSGKEVIDILEELTASGKTIIMVTHDESLAKRAQRVIRLLDGRMVAS